MLNYWRKPTKQRIKYLKKLEFLNQFCLIGNEVEASPKLKNSKFLQTTSAYLSNIFWNREECETDTNFDSLCCCLAMSLKRIRRCRRQAKKRQRVLGPIWDWVEQNQKYIKGLEKLLGEIRREEKSLERLVYKPRTDAVYRALENYSDD